MTTFFRFDAQDVIRGERADDLILDEFRMLRDEPYIPPACRSCPNHPSNGGTGICHCTLGLPQITY